MSDPASYKQLKEDFVSNLAGGDVTEINLVTAVAPVAVLLWSVLQSRHAFFIPYTPLALVVDFLLNSAAILLALTLYASRPIVLNLLLLAPAIVLLAASPRPPRLPRPSRPSPPVRDSAAPRAAALPARPFLTTYRGAMMVVTCAAILAVDFRLFPRRFAKVETWGTSLMDVGVGSFVFSAGLVGARPVLKEQAEAERAGRGAAAAAPASLPRRVLHSLRHSLPLLALGVIRLMSVKILDYAEHVTEYGVHWNFFFTLAWLPPFMAILQSARRLVPSHAALAVMLSGLYEVALATTPLGRFILTAPRTDLLSMNREGIFSFIGYLAIYLAGQDAGMFVMPRSAGPRGGGMDGRGGNSRRRGSAPLLKRLAAWSALWTGLYLISTHYRYGPGLTVSRRLANLPYVLWVAAFNVSQITAFCLIDALLFPERGGAEDGPSEREAHDRATSPILRAFNRNGLFVFLIANLLTGLVNLTVPTLDAGPPAAMGILVLYMAALTSVAVGLDYFDISIKM